jgi:hypothetical protein
MTVPTAGDRPELLDALIQGCGLPANQIVVVPTRPGVRISSPVHVIEDFGPPNIQRWWNLGIQESERRGATYVAVVNDDISVGPETLQQLKGALESTPAAIASPSRPPFRDGVHTRPLIPYEPRLWGSLWVLKLAAGLRPDERYVWWYGDNDLDLRARRSHGGVVLVDVVYQHLHPGEGTGQSSTLVAQTAADAATFERQYRWLLRWSRIWSRWWSRSSEAS